MRQLKFHEQKLLKKVNFLQWKNEHNQRELQVRLASHDGSFPLFLASASHCTCEGLAPILVQVMRRYHIQNRDDYKKYNKVCGIITKLVSVIKRLDARDPARIELTEQVLDKCAPPCLPSRIQRHAGDDMHSAWDMHS